MDDEAGKVITHFQLFSYGEGWFGLRPWIIGVPEGTLEEWRSVLEAIRMGKKIRFSRLEAIPLENGNVRWSSPRNSNGAAVEMPKCQIKTFLLQASQLLSK